MAPTWRLIVPTLALAGALACSKNPVAAKQKYLASGDRYVSAQKYQEAIVEYKNAIAIDPRFGEARSKLAGVYLTLEQPRNALSEAIRAADLMPDSVPAQLQAGELLLVSRQFPEAKARALAALEKDPKNPNALVLFGNALAGLKDLQGAIDQVQAAIDQDPKLAWSYANLGALYVAKGDRAAAESALKRAVEVAPDSAMAHMSLANFEWATGRSADAERELKLALQLEPKSELGNRALAVLYMSQRKTAEAEPYLKASADISDAIESKLVLADYYVQTGKVQQGVQALNDLSKDARGYVSAMLRLAVIDFSAGRRSDAYGKLDEVLKKRPKNVPTLEAKARFLLTEGKNQDALAITKSLADGSAATVNAQYLHALALERTGSLDEATRMMEGVVKAAPSSESTQLKLASLYFRQGRFKEALAFAGQVVKAAPTNGDAHMLYAQSLLKSGDLRNAEPEFLMLAKAAPNSANVHTWLGMLYEAKRDLKHARESYQKALTLDPDAPLAIAGLVSADLDEKKPQAALARVEARLAKDPNDVKFVVLSAMAYMAVNDKPKAEAAYRKVIDLDPSVLSAYDALGALYVTQNRLDDARKTYEDLAKRQEKPVGPETMLGIIAASQNRQQEAHQHFERALSLDPSAAVAANNLAWEYADTGGDLNLALKLAQTAKAQLHDVADISDTLGWVYYKKGLTGLAVGALEEASRQGPRNPSIRYRLGLAYLKNGETKKAKDSFEQALKLSATFKEADDTKRQLASIKG